MHSVERSPEPAFFAEFRTAHTQWDDLDGTNRRRIRDALIQDFGQICAYCERACQFPTGSGESSNEETIDHFRPRNRFPDLWLDWLNLVYACHRCNQNKGGSWPGYDDASINQWLSAEDSSLSRRGPCRLPRRSILGYPRASGTVGKENAPGFLPRRPVLGKSSPR